MRLQPVTVANEGGRSPFVIVAESRREIFASASPNARPSACRLRAHIAWDIGAGKVSWLAGLRTGWASVAVARRSAWASASSSFFAVTRIALSPRHDFALLIAIANIGGRKLGKFRPRLHIAEPRSAVISDVSFSCLDHRLVSARCSAGPSGKRSIALFVARPCGDSVKSAARSGLRHHHSANRQIRRLRGSNVRCEEWTRHRV
jgi:hypothetical protein